MKNLIAKMALSICLSSTTIAFADITFSPTINTSNLFSSINDAINSSDKKIEELAVLKKSIKIKQRFESKKGTPSIDNHLNRQQRDYAALLSQQTAITKELAFIDSINLKQEAITYIQLEKSLYEVQEGKLVSNIHEKNIYDV